ncbi:MAG: S8 family serine peptidase, partial [candidate division WOR-3 bacterium]
MKKFTIFFIPVLIAGILMAYSSEMRRIAAKDGDGIRTTRLSQRQNTDRSEKSTLSETREYTSSLDVKEAIRIDINEKLLREKRLLETMRKPPDLIPFEMIKSTIRRTVSPVQRQDTDQGAAPVEKRTWHKPEKPLYVPGEVLIQLKQDARGAIDIHTDAGIARFGMSNLDMLSEQFGVTAIYPVLETVPEGGEEFGLDLIFVMEVGDDLDIEALSEAYRAAPEVDEVSPNYIPFKHDARAPGRVIPDDPNYEWSDSIVKGPECWDIPETGSNSVVIAVLDIERLWEAHPDLDGNYLGFKGGLLGSADHGTMCISVACAELNNAIGISGLCGGWDGTQGVRWTGYVFSGASDNITAITWAVSTAGADIITESIGFGGNPAGLESAFEWAYSQGVLSFISAGNDAGSTEPGWPAYYGVVMAVGGVSPAGELWDWGNGVGSSVGEYVDIMGPGDAQYTCDSTSYTNGYGGTSFATPAAAACAALMLSDNNSLTPAQLRERMIRAADYNEHKSPEYNGLMGAGIVNLYEAVKSENVNVSINDMLDVPTSPQAYSAVYPRALVQNRGTTPATFQVIAQAQQLGIVYADTVWVTDLPPNNEYSQHAEFVEFKRWNPVSGTYTFRIFTSLSGDMNTENDTLSKTVIATSGGTDTLIIDSDVAYAYGANGSPGWAEAVQIPIPQPCSVMAILYLPGDPNVETPILNWRLWEDNGSGGSPGTLVESADSVTVTYDAWNRIDITPYYVTGGYLYPGWADVYPTYLYMTHDDALDDYNWWYNGSWVLDDFFSGDFMIRLIVKLPAKYDHDAAAYAILSPGIHVISSMPYIPECEVKNIGKNTESFPVYFTVDSAGT